LLYTWSKFIRFDFSKILYATKSWLYYAWLVSLDSNWKILSNNANFITTILYIWSNSWSKKKPHKIRAPYYLKWREYIRSLPMPRIERLLQLVWKKWLSSIISPTGKMIIYYNHLFFVFGNSIGYSWAPLYNPINYSLLSYILSHPREAPLQEISVK
jgi:hypothetical protein